MDYLAKNHCTHKRLLLVTRPGFSFNGEAFRKLYNTEQGRSRFWGAREKITFVLYHPFFFLLIVN